MLRISLILFAFAASPAFANVCVIAPDALRTAAASADAAKAKQALRLVTLGEKLCEANGRGEATKKFAAAARVLNTDMAALENGAMMTK